MSASRITFVRPFAALTAIVLLLCGCGSSASTSARSSRARRSQSASTPSSAPSSGTTTTQGAVDYLLEAETPQYKEFPATDGRTLQQLADLAKSAVALGPATGVFVPGVERFAFALSTKAGGYVYAPTAIYIGSGPNGKAKGPYLAPADPMTVNSQYRSKENTGPGGIKAIYGSELPLPSPGTYGVLALTQTPKGLIGSDSEVAVAASSQIPNVGQRPPDITTETLASVHGNVALLTTRIPPENMHSVSFNRVLGKKPIVLLISTPALCISRVCGPVTDVTVQLQHEFGNKAVFIHQEVYVNNNPKLGLRPQLKAFHLETEPWLFTIDRHGIIRARLEGAFGIGEAEQAIEAAIRS